MNGDAMWLIIRAHLRVYCVAHSRSRRVNRAEQKCGRRALHSVSFARLIMLKSAARIALKKKKKKKITLKSIWSRAAVWDLAHCTERNESELFVIDRTRTQAAMLSRATMRAPRLLVRFSVAHSRAASASTAPAGDAPLLRSRLVIERGPGHPVPKNLTENLVFGAVKSEHMLEVDWTAAKGWEAPRISPVHPLSLDPAASCVFF